MQILSSKFICEIMACSIIEPFVVDQCYLTLVCILQSHYNDVIMSAMASQITNLIIIYSTVYSGADQRKHQISASLAFVRGIHRWPVNSPCKWPVTLKMFPFDDVIMTKRWISREMSPCHEYRQRTPSGRLHQFHIWVLLCQPYMRGFT